MTHSIDAYMSYQALKCLKSQDYFLISINEIGSPPFGCRIAEPRDIYVWF